MRAVIASGGIGDLIIGLPLLDALKQELGRFKIYTNYPEVLQFYRPKLKASPLSEIYCAYKPEEHQKVSWDWEYLIHITNFAWFLHGKNKEPQSRLYQANQEFIARYKMAPFIQAHPHYDGYVSHMLRPYGFTRYTLAAAMLGFRDLPPLIHRPKPLKMVKESYITVHCGHGENHGRLERSTKMWDYSYYEQWVALFQLKYPKIKVVQLGGLATSTQIKGVDYCFLGLDIRQSFQILAGSRLHIDGDSGLVHAATSFGVKCVVNYGPTPVFYFGYPQNINLSVSLECSGCWWSTDTWVKSCAENYVTPKCMDLIFPSRVMEEVEKLLSTD